MHKYQIIVEVGMVHKVDFGHSLKAFLLKHQILPEIFSIKVVRNRI